MAPKVGKAPHLKVKDRFMQSQSSIEESGTQNKQNTSEMQFNTAMT